MVEKYMERNKKISISQVDILEFFNFYKEIAKYQYLYTLENNLKIKLAFNESNFPHLLGLHKFKMVLKYKKQSDIVEAIKNNKVIPRFPYIPEYTDDIENINEILI